MRSVNLHAEAGSRDIAEALGSQQIGVRVWELAHGEPIGEYHLHHGIEEWLIVVAGAPLLRTPGGERTLRRGDVVCFPAGPAGAHRVTGPGTVLMLSDRAKLDAIEFPESGALFLMSTGVLFQGDASDGGASAERPVVNLDEVDAVAGDRTGEPAGYGRRFASLTEALGAVRLGATVYEADAGKSVWPYHYEGVEEEWLLVLDGTPTLRDPEGERALAPGDLVCFLTGPGGAHQIVNRSGAPVRFLMISAVPDPEVSVCVYPDSDKVGVWPWPAKRIRIGDGLGYWDGED